MVVDVPADAPRPIASRNQLYLELQPDIRRILRRLSNSRDDVEDLSGEAFVLFCHHYARFDSSRGVPLRPYLLAQLRHGLYSRLRSRRLRQSREVALNPDMAGEPASPDPTAGWVDQMDSSAMLRKLIAAIAALPHRQRCVLVWRCAEGATFEQIADRLAIRPATARSLLRHGRVRVRLAATAPVEPR